MYNHRTSISISWINRHYLLATVKSTHLPLGGLAWEFSRVYRLQHAASMRQESCSFHSKALEGFVYGTDMFYVCVSMQVLSRCSGPHTVQRRAHPAKWQLWIIPGCVCVCVSTGKSTGIMHLQDVWNSNIWLGGNSLKSRCGCISFCS